MRTPTQESDFTSDYVDFRVEHHDKSTPMMDTAFAGDIRYWSDGTESPVGDETIYLRIPRQSTYVPVKTADNIGLGVLKLPQEWIEELGIPFTPIEVEFLMTRPEYASQLDRFEDD